MIKSLLAAFVFYTLLSWVIFFRDGRVISAFARFYPAIGPALFSARLFLSAHGLNFVPTILLFAVFGLAFAAYFLSLRKELAVSKIILISVLFQAVVFFSYPIFSTDILSYVMSDRIANVYHQNVWKTKAANFPHDPFFVLDDWGNVTRIYGGVNQFFYTLPANLTGDDLLASLAAHKLVTFVFAVATLLLASRLLPDGQKLLLLAWNPLFIIETVGSGHNDILMIFFVVLGLFFFLKKRPLFLGVALALATQVKSTPLLLAFFVALSYLASKNIRAMLVFCLGYFSVLLAIFYFMGLLGPEIFSYLSRVSFSTSLYWQSLPQIVHFFAPQLPPVFLVLTLLLVLVQTFRILTFRLSPFVVFTQTILIYLLFLVIGFWNWYALWILALTPFLPSRVEVKTILILSASIAFASPLYHLSLRFNYQHVLWPVIIYLGIAIPPTTVFFYERLVRKTPD